ncbi:MAG: hypothetical protein GY719_21580 [bacterium]|nr:hypothetical protein [bacterium]
MRKSILLAIACGLCLPAAGARAHEISYDGKIMAATPVAVLPDYYRCIGDVDGNSVVDDGDVQRILDCFQGECSELDPGQDPDEECSEEFGCPEDLNHNHSVGRGDVRMVLANWGDCPVDGDIDGDGDADEDDMNAVLEDLGRDCRTDLDRNGLVGGTDLAIAEAVWGPHDDPHLGTDLDGDGLSIAELMAVFNAIGTSCRADFNYDGTVDFGDYCEVCALVGGSCSIIICPPAEPDPYDD